MSGGELPAGWVEVPLGELAASEPNAMTDGPFGSKLKSEHYVDSGVRVVRLGNLGVGRFVDNDKAFIPEVHAAELSKHRVFPGDLIIAALAEPVGRCCTFPESVGPAIVKADCVRFKPGPAVLPAFLGSWLNSPVGLARSEKASHGIGRLRMNMSEMRELPVRLAPLAEQGRIVAKLDELRARSQKARAALDAVPALLDKLKQSVLAAAFRGDLTAAWRAAQPPGSVEPASQLLDRIRTERQKRWEQANPKKKYVAPEPVDTADLPELPEGWCWSSLGQLLDGIEAGKSPMADSRPAAEGEYGVLKVSAVTWGTFDPSANKALRGGQTPESGTTVRRGDLLISRANTVELVGAVVLVEQDYPQLMLCDKTLRLLYSSLVDPLFLMYSLRTREVRAVFGEDATGTSDSMRNLSQPKISSAPIPLAPVLEQIRIAQALRESHQSIDRLGKWTKKCRDEVSAIDQSILAKAFRGELVPQDPNDEPAEALLARIHAETRPPNAQKGGRVRRS
jgi:type I restriction enzyme S subunit